MNRVLVNFAHPARSHSQINNALRHAIEGVENVTVNDLYANYPDFLIDVRREQALCESHDVIIFQHPFYWYSSPSIVKEWMDLVLEHGWAFGSHGNALKDKLYFQAISAGGDASTYQSDGFNRFTIEELTRPVQAIAHLCQMKWVPPFVVLGAHRGLPREQVASHAEDYRRMVIALRDSTLDLDSVYDHPFINSNLDSLIKRA